MERISISIRKYNIMLGELARLVMGTIWEVRASEHSERSEHTVVLSLRFYYIYRESNQNSPFTENYGKLRMRGMSA